MSTETDDKRIKEAEQNLSRVKSQPNPDPDLVKWYERRIETLKKSAKAWVNARATQSDRCGILFLWLAIVVEIG